MGDRLIHLVCRRALVVERPGGLALVTADGDVSVSAGQELFEALLAGWRRQQQARRLSGPLIDGRERIVRRFVAFTCCWPWQWPPRRWCAISWPAGGTTGR